MNIINPLVSNYLDDLYKPANDFLAALRTYAEKRHIPVITRDVERFLAVLLESAKPKRILEVGTAIGYSAAFMATTYEGCDIDTMEIDQKAYESALLNLEKMGLNQRVRVFHGDAVTMMKQMAADGKDPALAGYDIVFIDASKSKYATFFQLAMDLIKPGGIILCDNVLMRGTVANDCYDPEGKHKTSVKNVRAFLNDISNREGLETAILPIGDGLSMSIKKQYE